MFLFWSKFFLTMTKAKEKTKTKTPEQVSDLNLADYNPRKITIEKLKQLGFSMQEFGDLSGIIFNLKTKNLVTGHQRIKNLDPAYPIKKKKVSDKFGTISEGTIETPYGNFSYREVNWSVEKEKAANIAANHHGGEDDMEKLSVMVQELQQQDFNMDLLGFDESELKELNDLDSENNSEENTDFSGKNKELDPNSFEDMMELKLKYPKDDFLDMQDRFNIWKEKFSVLSNEQVLKELFLLAERTA